jgi:hypothetical protein
MEKLIYLIWAPPPSDPNAFQRTLLDECAPRLLALDPLGLALNVDDADSDVRGPVPTPDNELPVVAQVSLWLHAHDFRGPYEEILGDYGVRRAGYLVTEAMYTDYGRNEHHPEPRNWPDGERSPGVVTLTLLEMPARFELENWLGHWYSHQSPMPQWMQPRMRYVRNTVARGITPGAPPYRGIVEETWPSAQHIEDPMLFYGGGGSKQRLRENVRIMLDSVHHMFDFDRVRNYTLSEYLLKTVETR